jgi:2-octaprenyl-6-methoxyphenol hydroxylase
LVIAADGRNSPLRKAAGIRSIGWSYHQTAIVTTVEHEMPHDGLAHELFLPSGPFAILPMTGNRSSIVWTERDELAPHFLKMGADDFTAEIAKRFGDHWGAINPMGPRWSYPLSLHLARTYVKPRLALIGDAAHGMHPIAGQGLNLGLRDVAAMAEVLIQGARLGLDPGDMTLLRRYENWRRTDNVTLLASTDILNRLFSTDIAPIRFARDLGLGLVGQIGPLKRIFMRHAMGDIGRKPKLLDGIAI